MTEYVVLEAKPSAAGVPPVQLAVWVAVATVTARDQDAAIDAAIGEKLGLFKAVPARSWKGGKHKHTHTETISEPLVDDLPPAVVGE